MAGATTKLAKAQLDLREPVSQPATDKKHPAYFKPGSSIGRVDFDFNPKDLSTALQANWTPKPTKKPGDHPEFTGTAQQTLDMEMFFDATETVDGDVSGKIEALLATLKPTAKSKDTDRPCPPFVVFSWGSMRPFVGVVKSVSCSMTLFRPSGQPVRASCKVSILEYPLEPDGQNPTSGAVRSTRSHRVVLGDTLASIAHGEYGTPTLWRAIAKVNELDDPFNLRLGRDLLLPPPADAAEMS
jgi:nucleoid-associated protein YgaU